MKLWKKLFVPEALRDALVSGQSHPRENLKQGLAINEYQFRTSTKWLLSWPIQSNAVKSRAAPIEQVVRNFIWTVKENRLTLPVCID